ncbi:MAG TPA: thiamine pyrophosphate-dependent enzyme [Terracidiphilus sp.]|jgi:TPP-dependent pyruvate/acetoin dehydrogenase alpha subunit
MTKSNRELPPAEEGFSLISNQKLLSLYSAMLACRSIAERSGNPRKNKRPDSILGHEAAAVGAAIDLLAHDTVAHAFWQQDALKVINPSVSVAPSIALAARACMADQDGHRITLLFPGSTRVSQPAWLKTLTLAADRNLPMLFVSLSHPEPSAAPTPAESALMERTGYAVPWINVDGNDVVAVYRVASEAITHARKGHGPTLIDCRLSTAGDPLQNMHKYLTSKGLNPNNP